MAGQYVCPLDAETQKKAHKELNEDPKNRQGAIDTFRTWILQQKHIKCPTDDVFLLAFLRARKFSQLAARQQLEGYMKRREKFPQWYKNLDPSDPSIQNVIDGGCVLMLPGRDKEGRRVFILKLGNFDVSEKKYKKADIFRTMAMVFNSMYLTDEATQVNGTVSILDFSHITFAIQTKISMDDRKNFIGTWQKNYPARIKGFHLYNAGSFMEFVLLVVKLAMSEKVQKRLVLHNHGLESVYKYIPEYMMPEEYLSDDYTGPNAGSEKKIIDDMKKMFTEPSMRDRLKHLSSEEFHIDMKDKDTDVPVSSFRKLNVD